MMVEILCLDLKREWPSIVVVLSYMYVAHSLTELITVALFRYLLPMAVAGISFIFRWIADFTCSSWSQTCRASSEILSHVYMVVFFFLVIVASTKAKQISDLLERVKTAYLMLTDTKDKHD